MVAAGPTKNAGAFYQTTWHHIQEDSLSSHSLP
jgi:hypothetical protein